MNGTPDPRVVEDLIARGTISLTRSARDANDETHQAIERAAEWLYQRARELRHE